MTSERAVAVLDHLDRQALLAAALVEVLAPQGGVQLRTPQELATEVDVVQDEYGAQVLPDRPLLWLWGGLHEAKASADERFAAMEILCAARSVAMLSQSPVVNRPTGRGSVGGLPLGPALAVRRTREVLIPGTAVRHEAFTTDLPATSAGLEVYDYGTWASSAGIPGSPVGPYRHRPGQPRALVAAVLLVGGRPVLGADLPEPVLASSRAVAHLFSLDVARLWWLVPDDGDALLARVECVLSDVGLGASVTHVAGALADLLGDVLAARMPTGPLP